MKPRRQEAANAASKHFNSSVEVPASSDPADESRLRWNVGPERRWQVFREATRILTGQDSGETCPDKAELEARLGQLRHDACSSDFSSAASGFLFRKVMDSPAKGSDHTLAAEYQQKLAGEPPRWTRKWFRLAERTVKKLFPKGWDRGYSATAANWTLAEGKSVAEKGLDSRDYWQGRSGWWYRHVVGGIRPEGKEAYIPEVRRVKVLDEGGGKRRLITIASGHQHVLAPLHHLIYSRLSKHKFLLRGDASPSSLSGMRYAKKEVFVSGDYEAATDNIPSSLTRVVLSLLRKSSNSVPDWIWDAAVDSTRGFTSWIGRKVEQRTGQLMGNYLSFPLLCLINLIAFVNGMGWNRAWEIIDNGLCKINGDDILFRSTRDEAGRWCESVQEAGFTLSRGKTLIHPRFASINSTFFCITKKVSHVPVIRSKTWFYKPAQDEVSQDFIAGRGRRVYLDSNRNSRVVGFFLGVMAHRGAALETGSVSREIGKLGVPTHVNGVTSFASVVAFLYRDPTRRDTREEKIGRNRFKPGGARGDGAYYKKLAADVSHCESFADMPPEELRGPKFGHYSMNSFKFTFGCKIISPEEVKDDTCHIVPIPPSNPARKQMYLGTRRRDLFGWAVRSWRSATTRRSHFKTDSVVPHGMLSWRPVTWTGAKHGGLTGGVGRGVNSLPVGIFNEMRPVPVQAGV